MNAKLPAPRLVVGTGARPFVEIRKVEKTYLARGAGLKAIDGFTLDLAAGEFLSIVGPSGCGKSTLMMMVAGLAPVSAGEIVIQGQRISGPHTDVGVIFQRDALRRRKLAGRRPPCIGEVTPSREVRGLER